MSKNQLAEYYSRFCEVTCFTLRKAFTHFRLMFYLYAPWKRQKTSGFLMFSEGINMEHWLEMA